MLSIPAGTRFIILKYLSTSSLDFLGKTFTAAVFANFVTSSMKITGNI